MGAPSNRTATLESQMIPMIQDVPGQTLSKTEALPIIALLSAAVRNSRGKFSLFRPCRSLFVCSSCALVFVEKNQGLRAKLAAYGAPIVGRAQGICCLPESPASLFAYKYRSSKRGVLHS